MFTAKFLRKGSLALAAAGALTLSGVTAPASGAEDKKPEAVKWAPAVKPKELSENVKKGLAWLVAQQLESGAWTQGEESAQMGGSKLDKPSVADTCVAALALFRSGSTPKSGDYAKNVTKAAEFVCSEIEKAKESTLFVTDVRGTRVQSKIGQYVDTFMACMLLSELKGQMADQKAEDRLVEALNKVVRKMSENQREDGGWGDQGWAATVGQSYGTRGLNRAAQNGVAVPAPAMARAEKRANESFDAKSGKFKAGDDAGVALYSGASSIGALQDVDNTNRQREDQAKKVLAESKDQKERDKAEETLKTVATTRKQLQAAQTAIVNKMDDASFAAGFGSNGGEEFLSHLSIGESLVTKGGADWEKWDKSMTENLNKVQNKDGSWTGHHCITGRTFCTSTALLVLMVDRSPVPVSGEMKRR
jgi:hypothetical protein